MCLSIATFSNNSKSNKTCNVKMGFYCYANDEDLNYIFFVTQVRHKNKQENFKRLNKMYFHSELEKY